MQNNNYENADKVMVYGLTFTCEEIDYLDSKAEGDARRMKEGGGAPARAAANDASSKASGRTHKAGPAKGVDPDDIPF